MRVRSRWLCVVLLAVVCSLVGPNFSARAEEKSGSLLIIGGGLKDKNAEIHDKLKELAGGEKACIAVIGTANSKPASNGKVQCEVFRGYGMQAEYIDITIDNFKTTAYAPEICEKIRSCTGVYFLGGDQARIIKALYTDKGERSPALDAIWDVYRRGGVISGSSAGAAIMSNPMFMEGDPLAALDFGIVETSPGAVLSNRGFGFFEGGIVDQHFGARGRLPRLLVALAHTKTRFGFGIDENTAMIVTGRYDIQAIGEGGIFIADMAGARALPVRRDAADQRSYFAMEGIRLSYIEKGDRFNWQTQKFTIAPPRKLIGSPYYENNCFTGDILAPGKIHRVLCELIDNTTFTEAIGLAIVPEKFESGRLVAHGYKFEFIVDEKSKGYFSMIDQRESYSVLNMLLKIGVIDPFTLQYQTSMLREIPGHAA